MGLVSPNQCGRKYSGRNTVKNDIDIMIVCGIDIVADKGTQMKYSYVHPFF